MDSQKEAQLDFPAIGVIKQEPQDDDSLQAHMEMTIDTSVLTSLETNSTSDIENNRESTSQITVNPFVIQPINDDGAARVNDDGAASINNGAASINNGAASIIDGAARINDDGAASVNVDGAANVEDGAANVNDDDASNLGQLKEVSSQTVRTMKAAVRNMEEYCKQLGIVDWPRLPLDEINSLLTKFYKTARRKDGGFYSMNSLNAFRNGIARYLFDIRGMDLRHEAIFRESNKTLKSVIAELKNIGVGLVASRSRISQHDIDRLMALIDVTTARGLQEKVLFDLLYHFSSINRSKLRHMTKDMFAVGVDMKGRSFVCEVSEAKKCYGLPDNHYPMKLMYATEDASCPVANFQKMISKLHPDCKVLWQVPRREVKESDLYWYVGSALGKNALGCFMKKISQKYGLSKSYTNQCCRGPMSPGVVLMKQLDETEMRQKQQELEKLMVESFPVKSSHDIQSQLSVSLKSYEQPLPPIINSHPVMPPQSFMPAFLRPTVPNLVSNNLNPFSLQLPGPLPLRPGQFIPFDRTIRAAHIHNSTMPTLQTQGICTVQESSSNAAVASSSSSGQVQEGNRGEDQAEDGGNAVPGPPCHAGDDGVSDELQDNPLIIDTSPVSQDESETTANSSKSPRTTSEARNSGVAVNLTNSSIDDNTEALETQKSPLKRKTLMSSTDINQPVRKKPFYGRGIKMNFKHLPKPTTTSLENDEDSVSMKYSLLSEVQDAIDIYQELAHFPSIKTGNICNKEVPGHIQVTSHWSQRDLDRKENISFSRTYMIQLDVVVSSPPQEISKMEWNVESPSGKLRAVVRKISPKSGEDKQYIEIWSDNLKLHNISVEALDQHGKIYDDSMFGCLQWSHAETHLLYVAEKKKPEAKSYFDQKAANKNKKDEEKEDYRGEEFVYEDDWGEQMVGKTCGVLCVLDVEVGAVSVLENLPTDVTAGPAVWCPEDMGIICVGTYSGPFRLGRIYCPIRRSALFHIDLKTYKCEILGSSDFSVASPVFSPDKTKLIFLETNQGGPHAQCSRIKLCDWSTKGIVTVKDFVRDIKTPEEFPGLFTAALKPRCWSLDSKRIVTSSVWRSKVEVLVIHIETGEITRLTNDPSIGTWTLLDVHNDIILAACSSPNKPHYLVLGHLPPLGKESSMKWTKLDDSPAILTEVTWNIHRLVVQPDQVNPKFPGLDCEYILLEPSNRDPSVKLPLAVFPHGGPHGVFAADFMLYTACLCRLGFIVVLVNYRGSYGFGQDSIESLPGRVGTQDVRDVQAVAEKALVSHNADPAAVVIMGGSHGGFLTTHLIGQYPDFYKAAVARNPVTNLATMTAATDILDWVYVEVGIPYDQKKIGSPELYKKAWEMSPIRYVDKVKTPVLLCIGQDDRRVPPQQANEYRKALAATGVEVRMLSYPGNAHPIIKVDSEADCFINIFNWFKQHIDQ